MSHSIFKKGFFIFCFLLLSFSLFAKEKMFPVTAEWKYKSGDDVSWAGGSAKSLDSSWKSVKMPQYISTSSSDVFWLKACVEIPSELRGKDVYFEAGNSYGAMEIYTGDFLAGHHGTLYPDVNFSHVSNTVVPISPSVIKDGKVEISIRCRTEGSHQTFKTFYIVDQERYNKVILYHPLLNNYVYYMMAAICIFLGLYFLFQFFADHKDKASLAFSFTLATVSVYFLDMASDVLFLPFNIQLSLARCCFVYSIGFLVIFLRYMFGLKGKVPQIIIYGIFAAVTLAYIINVNSIPALESLFTITLIPVFSGIVYMYVILIKARKTKSRNALAMIIGISLAMIFAIHDIIYQVIGNMPFAWLQGFSFFFIDIAMFIVVSLETSENKRKITNLVLSTSEQKDKLNKVIEDASRLSSETMEIANLLNDSVLRVANAAKESEEKALSINTFILNQNAAVKNTSSAIEKLANSVNIISSEVQLENQIVNSTVSETKLMVDGVNLAAEGVDNAASFAQSLGDLTSKSSNDIASLVHLLEEIKSSSTEILNVIKLVSDFSRKTNMLAMNASIEAAHSGDAGKGFAVIAHEINNLAGQSSAQTQRINDIVTAITENIARSFELSLNVKSVLEEVAGGAQSTTQKVKESAQGMEKQRQSGILINQSTAKMSDSAKKVLAETEEQTLYSNRVSSNMEVLSDFATQAEAAVEEVLGKNKELNGQAEELKALSIRIKEASEDLDNLIKI